MTSLPLVLLHGLNNTPRLWDGLSGALAGHCQIVTPELPAVPDVDGLAEVLLAQLPPRFWLGGFSFGGYVALALLAQAPQRIAGLALMCTSSEADTPAQHLRRRETLLAVEAGDYPALATAWGRAALHPQHRDQPAWQALRREMLVEYGSHHFFAHALAALARPERSHLLAAVPALQWVAGSNDTLYSPEAMRALRDRVGHGQLDVLGPAGHLVPLEQPQALAQVLLRWMQPGQTELRHP